MVLPFWFQWEPDGSHEKKKKKTVTVGHKVRCDCRLQSFYSTSMRRDLLLSRQSHYHEPARPRRLLRSPSADIVLNDKGGSVH